jgi:two-component system invasion response regulator UvrY
MQQSPTSPPQPATAGLRTVPSEPYRPRLLLVDDHAIVRAGLRRLIEAERGHWQVEEASSGFQALGLLRTGSIAMAIVDLSMPGMSGLDLIRRIKLEFPDVRLLVLSMHAEEQYALRAFSAGASGYLTKDSAANELMIAIGKVAAGGAYVSSSLAERVVQQLNGRVEVPRHTRLTDRELEIMRRLVSGRRLVDIARELHLSVKTVSTHKTRIQEKLQLPNLAALVRYGLEHQLDKSSISRDDGVV